MISMYSNTLQTSQFLRRGLITLLATSRQVSSYFLLLSNLARQTSILLLKIAASFENYQITQWNLLSLLNYQLSASISLLITFSDYSRISSPIVLLISKILQYAIPAPIPRDMPKILHRPILVKALINGTISEVDRVLLILQMQKSKEKQVKVYKGTFICNERRKRAGGRIKCEEFKNKIEVFGRNQAIHESQVEWTEVRRYKREKRNNKNQPRKDQVDRQNEAKKQITPSKVQTNAKYKQKQLSKSQKQAKTNHEKSEDIKKAKQVSKDNGVNNENLVNKKKKFKVKEQSQPEKQQKKSPHQDIQQKIEDQAELTEDSQNVKIEFDNKKEKQDSEANNHQRAKDEQNGQDVRKQEQNDDQSDQSEQQELEIIVGRIKKETKIKFQTKPFVGILDFEKRKKTKNKKDYLNNPIQQIMSDYYADLKPIHARLPIMELDDLNVQNYKILSDYAEKMVKFDKNQKRTKYLNRILEQLSSVYILMTFSEWDGEIPLANIHKIIGKAMTIDGECQRFLYEHGLNDFNYEEIQQESIPINPSENHKKVEQMVFTIDPPTSTDLDDALSIQKIAENVFNVGIHIADVTSYLHLIDRQEISKRTTSVYLPYKVYHMLNRNLVKVCSLDPGVERLAFTVWVTMDGEGNLIGESRVQKSIIKSRFKLSYGVVQDLISGVMNYKQFDQIYPCEEAQYEQLLEKLLFMVDIAVAHRSKRIIFDVFENREMQFKLDQDRWPVQCYVDKRYTAKKMVEEFMIIGNIESAKFIIKSHPNNALVIHHPKPNKLAVTQFNEQFKSLQNKIKFDNVMEVQRQLLKINQCETIKQETKNILFFKARRAMEPAIYRKYGQIIQQLKEKEKQGEKQGKQKESLKKKQGEQFPTIHFALGLQFYTHFTSPMRRMADIVVHETLTQIISGNAVTEISTQQIEKINNGRRSTKRLKKDLNQVYLCLMIYHTKKPIECQGIISSFGLQSVSIFIPIFDTQKQVLWKSEFDIHSIKRIKNKQHQMDVKLYHDSKTAKKDIYWVIQRFQKVELTLQCTKNPPLKLMMTMKVQSEKGPFTIKWIQEQ